MARVTAQLHAHDADAVSELGGWIHDADFDWEEIRGEDGVVTIPFAQEPDAELGLPESELVGTTRRGKRVYRVPFYRGKVTIARARRLGIETGWDDDDGQLSGMHYDAARGTIEVEVSIGPGVSVEVDAIDVTLTMTDEVVEVRRRTVGRWGTTMVPWTD